MTILSRERILQTKVTCKTSRICPRQRQWAKFNLIRQKSSTSKVGDEGGSGEFT